jgi:hypothetical protein
MEISDLRKRLFRHRKLKKLTITRFDRIKKIGFILEEQKMVHLKNHSNLTLEK